MRVTQIGDNLALANQYLCGGGLVAIPTETVYGLAANALDEKAVASIFEAKNRPTFDPLIVHVPSVLHFEKYAKNIPDDVYKIAEVFCPGPITFLLEKKSEIPDIVTAGLPKVALRVPNHPMCLALLQSLDFPLAAPSANPFGYISPTTAAHVLQQLKGRVDYILDGGPCGVGLESTIIGFEEEGLTIYRKGGLVVEELQKVYKKAIKSQLFSSSNPEAPGMLAKHYAPRKQVEIVEQLDLNLADGRQVGYLGFDKNISGIPLENQFILSENGDLNQAARKLFAGLRWLDSLDIDKVYIRLVPEQGLGSAINDRLRRAAAQ